MLKLSLVVCYLSLVLVGCVEQTKTEHKNNELERLSAVSVVAPGFTLEQGARLGWRSDVLLLRSEAVTKAGKSIDPLVVKSAIERQLLQHGHGFVNAGEADYVLVAAIVLGDSEKGQALEELARLYPSLEGVSGNLEKGMLMVGLSRPGSPVVLWRAAIQAYLAEEPTQEQSSQRLQAVITSLFRTLPVQ